MRNILWVVCWLSLLVSPSSKAYEQQYNVGDTGPNGGVVTSVTLESVLSDSSTELVGDFLETTDTYTYTETIVEEVETTTYETVQTTQEVTTNNLLTNSFTDTNINVVGNNYGMTGAEITTGNQSQGGGSRVYDIDVSDYDDIQEIDYGSTVYSHSSNTSVPLCANTTGDCKDQFKITVRLYDSGVLTKQYTHNYSGMDWAGSRDYSYNQDVSNLSFNTAELELYGIDAGYTSGYYGPGFSDMFFTATYNQIAAIVNTIINTIEQTTIKQTTEYVYSSEYLPPVDVVYEPMPIDISFDMEFQDPEGGTVEFDFVVVEDDSGGFDLEITTFEDEMQTDFETMDIDVPMDMEEIADEINIEMDITEEEPDSETTGESTVETEEEGEQETVQPQQTKERVAQKIMARVIEQGNQTVLNNVKLAVMAQLADTEAFEQYQAKQIVDNNFEVFMQEPLEDPYAIMYDMGNDYLMEQMVNQQWQN